MPPSAAASSAIANRSGLALRRNSPRSHMAGRPSRITASHWSNPRASEVTSALWEGLGQLTDQRPDRATTHTVALAERFDEKVSPCAQPLHGVHSAKRRQQSLDVLRDNGSDQ